MACPFCEPDGLRIVFDDPLVCVLQDAYPVSEGHLLIIPRRHVARWNEATVEERSALITMVERASSWASGRDTSIDGFNIGWNDGPSAGQTVMHLHVHVIPRRSGDVIDPRGGIRWVIPDKARYWTK